MLAQFARRVETEIGITISVGLSHNKFLAKIASDLDKPRGFAVIGRAETLDFLARRPISLIYGVGKVLRSGCATRRLRDLSASCSEPTPEDLIRRYGETGARLARLARGDDVRAPSRSTTR